MTKQERFIDQVNDSYELQELGATKLGFKLKALRVKNPQNVEEMISALLKPTPLRVGFTL